MEDEAKVISSWTDYFKKSFRFWVIGCCLISLYISWGNIFSSFSQGHISFGIGLIIGACIGGILLAIVIGSIFATIRKIIGTSLSMKVKKEQ